MSVNTLRKHVATAVVAGWLSVESRAGQRRERVRNVYQCTVPDHVRIEGADEEIAETLAARNGDAAESLSASLPESPSQAPSKALAPDSSVSRIGDTDPSTGFESVSLHSDTDPSGASPKNGHPREEPPSVSNAPAICVNPPSHLCQKPGSSVSTWVDTEVLKSSEKFFEGAAEAAGTTPSSKALQVAKARRFLEAAPATDDARIAAIYNLTREEVRQVREDIGRAT